MTKKIRGSGVESIDDSGNICRGLIIETLKEDNYLVYFFKRFSPPSSSGFKIVNIKDLRDLDDTNFLTGDKILINFQDTRPNRIGLCSEGDLFNHFGETATILEWYAPFGEAFLIPEGKSFEDRYFTNQPWLMIKVD